MLKTASWELSIIGVLLLLLFVQKSYGCFISSAGKRVVGKKKIVSGYYSTSFEHSGLTPEGDNTETWWVTIEDKKIAQRLQRGIDQHFSLRDPIKKIYIKARGCVSPEGNYGHLGNYPREIKLLELIEVGSPGQS